MANDNASSVASSNSPASTFAQFRGVEEDGSQVTVFGVRESHLRFTPLVTTPLIALVTAVGGFEPMIFARSGGSGIARVASEAA